MIAFDLRRRPLPFLCFPLLPKNAVLFAQPLFLATQLGILCGSRRILRKVAHPFAKGRKSDPRNGRHLAARQSAVCRDPNRFAFEIATVFGCHNRFPLSRALLAENRHESDAGPGFCPHLQPLSKRTAGVHYALGLRTSAARGCQHNLRILSALSAVAARPAHEVVRLSPVSKTGAASMSSASSMAATRSSAAINPACSQSSIASNLRTNLCCRGSGASAIA